MKTKTIGQNLIIFILTQSLLIFGMSLSLWRYNQGQLFYYDFGIFAKIIYQLSQFQLPYIDHIELGRVMFLGDHFNPSLTILAPLFWLIKDIRILVSQQALSLALSGIVIYKICRKLKLEFSLSLAVLIMFFTFPGILNPLVTDWHPATTANLFLLLFIYLFAFKKKFQLSLIFYFTFLGFKESNAITISMVLVWLWFFKKELRKEIITLFGLALIWFLATTRLIIPAISHHKYIYSPEMPNNLSQIYQSLTVDKKINFVKNSLKYYLYLPLLSGWAFIPALGEYLIRILPLKSKFESFNLNMHYNVYLTSFLSLATALTLLKIQTFIKKIKLIRFKKILILALAGFLILATAYINRKTGPGAPINLVINRVFWRSLKNDQWVKDRVLVMLQSKSIMAQNNLLPYFVTKSNNLYLFKGNYNQQPDIIAFDISAGQNANNFYGSNLKVVKLTVDKLKNDPNYHQLPTGPKDYYVFVRSTARGFKN